MKLSTKHVLVQGVYVGSASPLIADIKTEVYSVITYTDDGMLTGTYDNTYEIPIYIDNGTTDKYNANCISTRRCIICITCQKKMLQPKRSTQAMDQ